MGKLQNERILAGQCPNDGNEAAPYRLCHECRQKIRFGRALKTASKKGIFKAEKIKGKYLFSLPLGYKNDPAWNTTKTAWEADGRSENMGFDVLENDRRYGPKLRGIRVDVEKTLLQVISFIGRPCSIDDILAVWGRLRSERHTPLAQDLGRLIKAQDRRERRLMKVRQIASRNA